MDYSQFLAMKQEIGLLVVFLLVFLYDTFMPKKAQGALPIVAIIGMVALTVLGLLLHARLGRIYFGFCRNVRDLTRNFSHQDHT